MFYKSGTIASEAIQPAVVPSSPRVSPRPVIPVRARVRSSSSVGATAQSSAQRVRKMCSDTGEFFMFYSDVIGYILRIFNFVE